MREATASISLEPADTSHMGHDGKTFIIGQNDATFSGSGLYDGSVGGIEDLMEAAINNELLAAPASIPLTFAPEGLTTVGAFAALATPKITTYEVNPVISDVVAMSFEMQANGGMFGGHVGWSPAVFSATTDAASIDNLVTSPNGAIVYLHVLSNANNGNFVARLQHSTNNSTWVDLITLTSVTSGTLTAYRIGESTGTVNRYLRASITVTGTGNISAVMSYARK